jgi:hypothetical protein
VDAGTIVALVLAGAVTLWQIVVVRELRAIHRELEDLEGPP